jgi:DNA-binding response OmpR family regulator
LVVEDEHRIAAYLKRGLEEHGYAVDAAYTGREALDWCEAVQFDLIVLDLLLPELDGYAVCRELRRRDCRVPILMLTARDTVADRVSGLDAGADDYVVKPFALSELLARLRALARRSAEAPKTAQIQLADLVLDPVARRVTRGGQSIFLTAKEFAVLDCLLREPGRTLTRAEIAEHVWNYDADLQSNVVDVYIRNLRRKLDDGFEPKLIHTVRGAGYCLSAEPIDEAL